MRRPLTIRLTAEARQALERLAQQDDRSMSGYLSAVIKEKALQNGVWLHTAPKVVSKR